MAGESAPKVDQKTEIISDESARLRAVRDLAIIDTPTEQAYDHVVDLVCKIFSVDIAAVSILDGHRFWLKSAVGSPVNEADRRESFSQFTLAQDGPFIVPDTHADPRFKNNPFVTGPPYVRFYAGVPVRSADGVGVGTLCAVDTKPRRIGERQMDILKSFAGIVSQQLELRNLAIHDELTGALSRRAFRDEAARISLLATRHRHNLTAICIDLDHFKSVNDRFGHAAGDTVLRAMSDVVRARLRKSDLFARLGGEEFAVLLPETDRQGALEVAENLRKDISALRFEFGGETVGVTASFGVATYNIETKDFPALLQRADAALYQAKTEGRNRSIAFGTSHVTVKASRRRVLKAGKVSFRDGGASIDCTVRTLGPEGAGMDLISTADVPDRFRLVIRSDGLNANCQVLSRTRTHLEVEFV